MQRKLHIHELHLPLQLAALLFAAEACGVTMGEEVTLAPVNSCGLIPPRFISRSFSFGLVSTFLLIGSMLKKAELSLAPESIWKKSPTTCRSSFGLYSESIIQMNQLLASFSYEIFDSIHTWSDFRQNIAKQKRIFRLITSLVLHCHE